jgi:hypothetical protein
MLKMSECQYQSRNSPGFDPTILRHSGIWGAADVAVLNKVHLKISEIPVNISWLSDMDPEPKGSKKRESEYSTLIYRHRTWYSWRPRLAPPRHQNQNRPPCALKKYIYRIKFTCPRYPPDLAKKSRIRPDPDPRHCNFGWRLHFSNKTWTSLPLFSPIVTAPTSPVQIQVFALLIICRQSI